MLKIKQLVSCHVLASCVLATAVDAAPKETKHFIFFGLDRERIHDSDFLDNEGIAGAQLKYMWRELEPSEGVYDFDGLLEDLSFLTERGKLLFVQLQDVTFSEHRIPVPAYLLEKPEYNGGVAPKFVFDGDDESSAVHDGWTARRWDPSVRGRFHQLLRELGEVVDGRIAGINLAETAIGFGESGALHPAGFTYDAYAESVKTTMSEARAAFESSEVIQYANFMPGEWLPWNDKGYLRGVYEHANQNDIGVGGPDVLPFRKGQKNHSYPLIANRADLVIAGVAVQDGNLAERDPSTGRRVSPQEIAQFATQVLRVNYIFWGTEEPHYTDLVLPYLAGLGRVDDDETGSANKVGEPDRNQCSLRSLRFRPVIGVPLAGQGS